MEFLLANRIRASAIQNDSVNEFVKATRREWLKNLNATQTDEVFKFLYPDSGITKPAKKLEFMTCFGAQNFNPEAKSSDWLRTSSYSTACAMIAYLPGTTCQTFDELKEEVVRANFNPLYIEDLDFFNQVHLYITEEQSERLKRHFCNLEVLKVEQRIGVCHKCKVEKVLVPKLWRNLHLCGNCYGETLADRQALFQQVFEAIPTKKCQACHSVIRFPTEIHSPAFAWQYQSVWQDGIGIRNMIDEGFPLAEIVLEMGLCHLVCEHCSDKWHELKKIYGLTGYLETMNGHLEKYMKLRHTLEECKSQRQDWWNNARTLTREMEIFVWRSVHREDGADFQMPTSIKPPTFEQVMGQQALDQQPPVVQEVKECPDLERILDTLNKSKTESVCEVCLEEKTWTTKILKVSGSSRTVWRFEKCARCKTCRDITDILPTKADFTSVKKAFKGEHPQIQVVRGLNCVFCNKTCKALESAREAATCTECDLTYNFILRNHNEHSDRLLQEYKNKFHVEKNHQSKVQVMQ